MPIVKVIELLSQSNKSWEDAAQVAVTEASKTIKGIKSVYVKDFQAVVENNKVTEYRLNVKVSFVIDEAKRKT
jgi:dodecin